MRANAMIVSAIAMRKYIAAFLTITHVFMPFLAMAYDDISPVDIVYNSFGKPVETDQVAVFVSPFTGPGSIGQNVSTLINLQIWKTLRKAPAPNPRNLNFGHGKVWFSWKPLPDPQVLYAEQATKQLLAQMTLWGDVAQYGDGYIVQATLSIPEYKDGRKSHGEIWEVRVGGHLIRLDIPRRLVEFAPVAIRPEVAERFSTPAGLPVCPTKTLGCEGTSIGPAFAAIKHESAWSYVRIDPGPTYGWVYLPELGQAPNEIASFTGGMVSYFRTDFEQADSLFRKVLTTQATRSPVRFDAMLLRAAALSRMGRTEEAENLLGEARELNPYSRYLLQASTMIAIQRAEKWRPDVSRRYLAPVFKKIKENIDIFPEGDVWLQSINSAANDIN